MFSEEYNPSDARDTLPGQSPAEPPNHDAVVREPQSSPFLPTEQNSSSPEDAPERMQLEIASPPAVGGQDFAETREIETLFASMDDVSAITPGEIITCKVLKVTEGEVIIDVGIKSEA